MHGRLCSFHQILRVLLTIGAFVTAAVAQNPPDAISSVPSQSASAISTAQALTVQQTTALTGLQFIPVTPCRIADTRWPTGPFGGPEMAAGTSRSFNIPQSGCSIPSTAVAYSLNVTVVPDGFLSYLTLWPTGETQPYVSTLNSDGRVKANAAITPAGTNGAVSVFVSNATNVILDIDGYFVPAGTASALAFYPVTPCRVADTRNATGPLGGPTIAGGSSRSFPVQSSSCGIPATAKAYSLNVTAVPHTTLGYLTAWATGQTQPYVSTLNSSTGAVTANAAVVPAGTSGAVSIFVSDTSDVILDVNGYFAPPATGGLSLYPVTPCRVIDTRSDAGAFNGVLAVDVETSACAPPSTAQGYVLNGTVVPPGSLDYLTLWPAGEAQPYVSTLNALDGAITSNMAIVPTTNGSIDAFSSNLTNLILDLSSYFAPSATSLPAAVPVFSPAGGTYTGTQMITITDATPGAVIDYTINGTTPTTASTKYTGAITVSSSQTLEAIATALGYSQSPVVSAAYTISTNPTITGVTVSPNPGAAILGTMLQFSAAVSGTGNYNKAVTWSVAGPSNWTGSIGSISSSGLYETPYPAPATVTVTAAAVGDTTKTGSVTVTLQPPATTAGPALKVDAGNQLHAISPYIYGMNAYQLEASVAQAAGISIARWGGDNTSRYNYQSGMTNSASDYYFENQYGSYEVGPTGQFNDLVTSDSTLGIKTLGTVPVLGWVAKDSTSCSFPTSTYPNQQQVDTSRGCGNGVSPEGVNGCTNSGGCDVTGDSPTVTSVAEGPSWVGSWVTSLVQKFGTAANGGVAVYDLDNEPSWWDAVHRDVHPLPFTYDEVTNNGIATAVAIKTADPTAEVSGPVIDYWWDYFYSKKDVESGWSSGPCYQPWQNPVDRKAHGGIALIEYYLQQFAAYASAHKTRMLDYVDLHTYFAATYNGTGVAFATAGDTGEQEARLNSTRVFWDPTYTDPNNPQPNYITDTNYTSTCPVPLQAPQVIPMMQKWVANDYPGTKTAITEYNWGGQEHINGALAQADILGIFGQYGLDLATLWGPPDASQVPGLMAYEIYRNYDGAGSKFGDTALASTSAAQGQLSVYSAVRSSDQAVTVVVINKTYGALTSTLSLANLTAAGSAKVYQYSNANLASIVALPDQAVTAPPPESTTSTIAATFPAASITLFVIPTE